LDFAAALRARPRLLRQASAVPATNDKT